MTLKNNILVICIFINILEKYLKPDLPKFTCVNTGCDQETNVFKSSEIKQNIHVYRITSMSSGSV